MPKAVIDAALDAAFDYIDQCNVMTVCGTEPTNYTEANSTYKLASTAMTPDTDYTKADAAGGGRQITVAGKNGVSITASGTANWVCLLKSGTSELVYKTSCTAQSLTSGGTVDISSWVISIGDPT